MEYVPGGSLDKFWRSHGRQFVPVQTTVDLIKQVCRGIAQAHGEDPPIIHRDIKPQNILVGYEVNGLRARVSDFGLAKKVNPLTLLASAAGTLAFKPPEVFTMRKGDSCAADVWAIGVTLYLLLTDRLPFEIPTDVGSDSKNLFSKTISPLSETNPDVNRALDAIVMKALERKPDKRFPTAKELLIALEGWKPASKSAASKSKASSNEPSKTVLGIPSPIEEGLVKELVQKAFQARQAGRLALAADLMEEAFNKSPSLRQKYAQQVKLWRCGVSM
jgi:serine/threonine-protein kinase